MYTIAVLVALVGVAASQSCPSGIPASEVNDFLNQHNTLRSKISSGNYAVGGRKMPAAKTPIPALTWDCDLEQEAQQWADQCVFQHSQVDGEGENLYMMWSSRKASVTGQAKAASQAWEKEFQQYGWRSPKFDMNAFQMGHATQMAWAKSTQLGCGMAMCQGGQEVLVVCRYKDAGNWMGENIYNPK